LHQSYENSWKLSLLITRVLYSDYIGPARLRLKFAWSEPWTETSLTPLL